MGSLQSLRRTMMIGKRLFAIALLGTALAVTAPDAKLTLGSAWAAGPTVSAKVGKPYQAAQKLIEQKKYSEALKKLDEADKVPNKTAYEQFVVNDLKGFVYSRVGNYASAAQAYEAVIKSGQISGNDLAVRQRAVISMYFQTKSYSKSLSLADSWLAGHPSDTDVLEIAGQSAYLLGNYTTATAHVNKVIQLQESAGKRPDEALLQVLMAAQYKGGDTKGYGKTLERLVRNYPKPKYWADLLASLKRKPGTSDKRSLEIYRLQYAAGAVVKAEDYRSMAEVALISGFPGDALTVLEKGFKAGILSSERDKKLLDRAKQAAASDQKVLAQLEAAAKAAPDGERDVQLGEAYASYGMYDKAIEALQRGLGKGGVKNVAEAKLNLARVYALANQRDKARKTFASINGNDGTSDIARLWLIHLS